VVLDERENEFLAGPFVVVAMVVVVIVVVTILAVVAVVNMIQGLVGRDEQGVVVLCVIEQLLDFVVLLNQLGEFGGVLAVLDQFVDGLVLVPTVPVPAVGWMRVVVLLVLIVGVNQGKKVVRVGSSPGALSYALLDR